MPYFYSINDLRPASFGELVFPHLTIRVLNHSSKNTALQLYLILFISNVCLQVENMFLNIINDLFQKTFKISTIFSQPDEKEQATKFVNALNGPLFQQFLNER